MRGKLGNLYGNGNGTALTYQWKKNGVNIGGATAASYTIPATVTADAGTYTVVVSGTVLQV
jgi:hypothetical protein